MSCHSPDQEQIIADQYVSEHGPLMRTRLAIINLTVGATKHDTTVLDLCCGTGETVRLLQLANIIASTQVIGVDRSEAMLKVARKNNPTATFVQMHLTPDSVKTLAPQDVVFFQAAIHWFAANQREQILTGALNLAKQSLYVSTTLEEKDSEGVEMKGGLVPYHRGRMTKKTFLSLALNAERNASGRFTLHYFEKDDVNGKTWMNIVFERNGTDAPPPVAQIIKTGKTF